MADVRPFRAVRYTPAAGRIADLVAPAYDIIPASEVPAYQALSPHNVIRLIRPGDDYEGAAATLRAWLESGILEREPDPLMYVHEVEFEGTVRTDLLAVLRLEPRSAGVVLPHEKTHHGPKVDRLNLLRATRASLEPLWFLYDGAGSRLPALIESQRARDPLHVLEFAGNRHRLWRVEDREWMAAVSAELAPRQVLIADGHHRYETTLAFSEELGGGPEASSRFTLALLTDLDHPGLRLLATHRVLKRGIAVTGGEEVDGLARLLERVGPDGSGSMVVGTYREGRYQVFELEGEVAVVELHRQVIDNILGRRSAEESLEYTRDPAEAVRWVDEGRGVAAFLFAGPHPRAVLKLAAAGFDFPQKSTYFYPKPPSGLAFHLLDPASEVS